MIEKTLSPIGQRVPSGDLVAGSTVLYWFTVPPEYTDGSARIQVEQSDGNGDANMSGICMGVSHAGMRSYSFQLRGKIKAGEKHVCAVTVDDKTKGISATFYCELPHAHPRAG